MFISYIKHVVNDKHIRNYTLLDNEIKHKFMMQKCHIAQSLENSYKMVAIEVINNSNTYDVILRFQNKKLIYCHSFVLGFLEYFCCINDFKINNKYTILDMNCDFEHIHFIINYLYTGTMGNMDYFRDNCIDILLIIDMFGFLNLNYNIELNKFIITNLIHYLMDHIEYIFLCYYNKNGFYKFIDRVGMLWDLMENVDCVMNYDIWKPGYDKIICCEIGRYLVGDNTCILINTPFFMKRFAKSNYGANLIIKYRVTHLFPKIVDRYNYDKLLVILFADKPKYMHRIIDYFVLVLPNNLSLHNTLEIPKDILNYKHMFNKFNDHTKKLLYEKFNNKNNNNMLSNISINHIIQNIK